MTEEARAPVKYTVLERSLIGNKIFEEGETAEYAGLPAENLAPQCEIGKARYQEYLETNAARVAQMKADNADPGVGDPEAFAKALKAALADSQANQADLIAAAVASAIARVFPNGTNKKASDLDPS